MSKSKSSDATLHLTIRYQKQRETGIIEAAREIVEKAAEHGDVEGFLELHKAERIDVGELR